jgi:hypothetical protein
VVVVVEEEMAMAEEEITMVVDVVFIMVAVQTGDVVPWQQEELMCQGPQGKKIRQLMC